MQKFTLTKDWQEVFDGSADTIIVQAQADCLVYIGDTPSGTASLRLSAIGEGLVWKASSLYGEKVFLKKFQAAHSNVDVSVVSLDSRGKPENYQDQNVRDWFAKGDGETSDTIAIQNAVNWCLANGGGKIKFPKPEPDKWYRVTSPINIDMTGIPTEFSKRIHIEGSGASNCLIKADGFSGPVFNFIGESSKSPAYYTIRGIRLQGNVFAGSKGISLDRGAFIDLFDVTCEGFDIGLYAVDVDQSSFTKCTFRWNLKGAVFDRAVHITNANSITFKDVCFGNNATWGLFMDRPNAVKFENGSFQYNGTTGVAGEYGCRLKDPGTGYGTVTFDTTVFEGNGGDYDLGITDLTSPSSLALSAVSFTRANNTNYATNNLHTDGAAQQVIVLSNGTNFRGYNNYVYDITRKNLDIDNNSAQVFDDGSTIWGSILERPDWGYRAKIPTQVEIGNGILNHVGSWRVRHSTDSNLYTGGPLIVSSGIALVSVDDNLNAAPMELRASEFDVNVGTNRNLRSTANFISSSGMAIAATTDGGALAPLELRGTEVAMYGTYNFPLRLSGYRLWVSSAGKLYIKNGVPANETDGTVVGTQT